MSSESIGGDRPDGASIVCIVILHVIALESKVRGRRPRGLATVDLRDFPAPPDVNRPIYTKLLTD